MVRHAVGDKTPACTRRYYNQMGHFATHLVETGRHLPSQRGRAMIDIPMQRTRRIRLIASVALLGAACQGSAVDAVDQPTMGPAPVTSQVAWVSMGFSTVQIVVGQTVQLQASPRTSTNGYTGATSMTWSTSDRTVATVTEMGLVTGVKSGIAQVYANVDGHAGQTVVTVTDPPPPGAR